MASIEVEAFRDFAAEQDLAAANLALVNAAVESFIAEHEDEHEPLARLSQSLELVEELRPLLEESHINFEYHDQVAATTQVDVIEWLVWKNLKQQLTPPVAPAKPLPGASAAGAHEFLAQERIMADIERMHALNKGYEQAGYDNLLNSFWKARLLVKNPPKGPVSHKSMDAIILAQQLNIYKTVSGLRDGGFTRARRATPEEKEKQQDIIVPLGKNASNILPIRLQPGAQKPGVVTAYSANQFLLVNTPYLVSENPFEISSTDRATLVAAVNEMRRVKLAHSMSGPVKYSLVAKPPERTSVV